MAEFWKRMTILRRIAWVILVMSVLASGGALIWGYPTWPATVLVLVVIVLNVVGSTGGMRNAQENDPNKR